MGTRIIAIKDLSFEVQEGEIIGLLGVNGAGKTTTFRMIMGLLDMTEGKITFNGKPIDYNMTDQIGFKLTERLDGRLILPEAVKCLQMKA